MDVRFRPLQPSVLARRANPGQAPSEDGLSFMEIVDSVTGAENNAEENTNSDRKQQSPARTQQVTDGSASVEEETGAGPEKPATSPIDKTALEEKPLGIRFDVTA